MFRKLYLAMALGAAVLGGCDSPSKSEEFDPVGTLSFSYQGAVSGTFQATGAIEAQPGTVPAAETGATAVREEESIALVAFQARGAGRGDAFALLLGDAEKGTLQLNPTACQQQPAPECRIGIFVPDVAATDLPNTRDPSELMAKSYVLALGAVEVVSRTRLRIKGTFQAVAVRADNPGFQNTINIGQGQFDLPIRPQE
ncbi:hypothetical protein [Longimicrobium sp.]|jgi:hypothetical protein|uniref:hypothetical protein n=1 Tax=Longimicrobium sp. TaxID=2029185 RepID=UPI002ED8BC15